jgi:two-component system chemotaxis response regulator CheY
MDIPEGPNYSHIRVLIVDDRAEMRVIIRSILQHLGIRRVETAADGEEALMKLRGKTAAELQNEAPKPFNLVISDWVMPKMDGVELLHAVRNDTKLDQTPFLMITSQNDKDSVLAATTLGVTDYVVKPFSARILEQKVLSLIHGVPSPEPESE